ncbi:MAG: hypothetical protein P8Z38_04570 [Robiginitalea sp.]
MGDSAFHGFSLNTPDAITVFSRLCYNPHKAWTHSFIPEDGVAVFPLPKTGLMADLSIGKQKFSYENFDGRDSDNL